MSKENRLKAIKLTIRFKEFNNAGMNFRIIYGPIKQGST